MKFKRFIVSSVLLFSIALPAKAVEVVHVAIADLHPTQGSIGHLQIEYKLQRYRIDRGKMFDDLCEMRGLGSVTHWTEQSSARLPSSYTCSASPDALHIEHMKTAVRGPNNQLYLTDGHHTFSTFQEMPEGGLDFHVSVRITHDKSDLSMQDFWHWMSAESLVWLFDENNEAIEPEELPQVLGREHMANNELRAAVYFLRGIAWDKPETVPPFVEFQWAQLLQPIVVPPSFQDLSREEYFRWLYQVAGAMSALPANGWLHDMRNAQFQLSQLICEQEHLGKLTIAYLWREPSPRCQQDTVYIVPPAAWAIADLPQVNALIEIPAGAHEKWEVDKNTWTRLLWDRKEGQLRRIQHLGYPVNYGTIGGTLADRALGGDGDPLDVLVLGEPLEPGYTYAVQILGVMRMKDNGEEDDKLLASRVSDPVFGGIETFVQLQAQHPDILAALEVWFRSYKGEAALVSDITWEGQEQALETVISHRVDH